MMCVVIHPSVAATVLQTQNDRNSNNGHYPVTIASVQPYTLICDKVFKHFVPSVNRIYQNITINYWWNITFYK